MNKKELAVILNNGNYGSELSKNNIAKAEEARLVVVFGYSDDNMMLYGAIADSVSCYEGGIAYLDRHGVLTNGCSDDDCPYFQEKTYEADFIEAIWDTDGYAWIYKVSFLVETFDIWDDGELYCQGIVFSLDDLKETL